MRKIWQPTILGKLFTGASTWTLKTNGEHFVLNTGKTSYNFNANQLEGISIKDGIFWSTIIIPFPNSTSKSFTGISNHSAKELKHSIIQIAEKIRSKEQTKEKIRKQIQSLETECQSIIQWASTAKKMCIRQLTSKGWLTHDFKSDQIRGKPSAATILLDEPHIKRHIELLAPEIKETIAFWKLDFNELADALNTRQLAKELQENELFFKQVEKSPLTKEQASAVVCFDNRVLLVASAGSGKTSTMVAKAGYALKKGYFSAEQMLLLAFNKKAADELKERITVRLKPHGLNVENVVAKTFHAFGLDVIGDATGKRPSVAEWVEAGRDIEVLLEIVDDLKDCDGTFRTNWDLFRIVLGQDLPEFGAETDAPDSWDYERKTEGFWTLNGETVKSRGEQIIANWLWYNGVEYKYEESYQVDTADARHRQYKPDFYFPEVNVYLEHWALDQNGNPPPKFHGYKEGMEWKRQLHAKHGTKLLETTMAELWSGKAFLYLTKELTKLGICLDPNPERQAQGRRPIENPRLAKTFRTFLTHAKSNRASIETLKRRLEEGTAGRFRFRHHIFLSLFEKIWEAWENKLKTSNTIDFDDMLGLATDCIESGKWESPYLLVMVDEFQDVSRARARLIAGLVKAPGRCLFAVGDDWQSINRFAGSDLSVMTNFEQLLGKAVTLKLETTFRCPQSLCNISSSFVQKNPQQLRKHVISAKPDVLAPIRIIRVKDEGTILAAVAKRIEEILTHAEGTEKRPKIYILGRYNSERSYLPLKLNQGIDVEFVTAHSSKGLEADHVIIPKMTSETLGFPSRIEDDPVMQLTMPSGDSFEFAEERRLFYVALTRARSTVTLITVERKESSFITELVRDYKLDIVNLEGEKALSLSCPTCHEGLLGMKKGRYGSFIGCNRYPHCRYTMKVSDFENHQSKAKTTMMR